MSSSNHQLKLSRIYPWLLWVGLAAAVAWLIFGHGEHVLKVAPFLILLACPLMHLFGHGHGGHSRRADPPAASQRPGDAEPGRGGHAH